LRGANLRRANLVGAHGVEADFTGALMYYARPGNADFSSASFVNAEIQRAIFRRANLSGADLTGAQGRANFEDAEMTGVRR
jgi:uncharacterized protein YjbI with pentapeptide repeats